jgi:hypothetical protein
VGVCDGGGGRMAEPKIQEYSKIEYTNYQVAPVLQSWVF